MALLFLLNVFTALKGTHFNILLDVVIQISRMRWFGHVEHAQAGLLKYAKLIVVAQNRQVPEYIRRNAGG